MGELQPRPASEHEADLVRKRLDGDPNAHLEIILSGNMIIAKQPQKGKSIIDPGIEVEILPMKEKVNKLPNII